MCGFKCSSGEYLFSNGTCISTNCDDTSLYVAVIQGIESICLFKCEIDASLPYLYQNDTCLPDCLPPYYSEIEGVVSQCFPPCSSEEDYFYWDETCKPTCNSPLIVGDILGV